MLLWQPYLDYGKDEKPVLLGADRVHPTEKGKSISGQSLAKLVKRALNYRCRGRGTSIHPTATSLMPGPAVDDQSLEKDHRSAGEHLKGSTEELQPVSRLHRSPNWNTSVQTHTDWGINERSQRHAHACRAMSSLASWRCGGMAPVTGVLEWKAL